MDSTLRWLRNVDMSRRGKRPEVEATLSRHDEEGAAGLGGLQGGKRLVAADRPRGRRGSP